MENSLFLFYGRDEGLWGIYGVAGNLKLHDKMQSHSGIIYAKYYTL